MLTPNNGRLHLVQIGAVLVLLAIADAVQPTSEDLFIVLRWGAVILGASFALYLWCVTCAVTWAMKDFRLPKCQLYVLAVVAQARVLIQTMTTRPLHVHQLHDRVLHTVLHWRLHCSHGRHAPIQVLYWRQCQQGILRAHHYTLYPADCGSSTGW